MSAYAISAVEAFPRSERIQLVALAVVLHALVLGLLMVGVSLKHAPPEANIVDLWDALPDETPAPITPAPAASPPPPSPPEPKVIAKPVTPPPAPAVEKPDIAFKDKKVAAKKTPAPTVDKKLQQQRAQVEAQRIAQEQADEQRRQQESARNKLRNEYVEKIRQRIKRFVVLPPNLDGNPQAEFDVTLLPGGEVLSARLTQSSGVLVWDQAVERAILKAQPLPLPPDPTMFSDFRELSLTFRPQE